MDSSGALWGFMEDWTDIDCLNFLSTPVQYVVLIYEVQLGWQQMAVVEYSLHKHKT